MRNNKFKPLGDTNYEYYRLTKNLGYNNSGYSTKNYVLPQGSVFVHDVDDRINGSLAKGCLTLCWAEDGNCQGWICGECLHLHACFRNTDLFEKIDSKEAKIREVISKLELQLSEAKKELEKITNK